MRRHVNHNIILYIDRHIFVMTGCLSDNDDIQREANKLLADYKFKMQKAEQDMSTLQATVARLESQVIRYKSAAEASEKAEDELKVEKRKLQREVRIDKILRELEKDYRCLNSFTISLFH